MKKEQKVVVEAHHLERISKLKTKTTDTLDGQYLMLVEIRDLLRQLVDGEATKAGKTPPEREELPQATYRKGKRVWFWKNK